VTCEKFQQFRRAIGVPVRCNAMHKLGCLHYILESMEEVANGSTAHHRPINGTQATMDMLAGIMPIHQMERKHNFSSGMDFS
jgi:hypothetical protein